MPPVSRALLALRYLTILPMSRRRHAGLEDLGRAAPWFPVVGAALGLDLSRFAEQAIQNSHGEPAVTVASF